MGFTQPSAGYREPEQLEFYPTFGRLHKRRPEWRLSIHGRVVKPRPDNLRRRLILRMIQRVLKATPEQLDSDIFRERAAGFLCVPRNRRRVRIRLGDRNLKLNKRSRRSGHFLGNIRMTEYDASMIAIGGQRDDFATNNAWWAFDGCTKRANGWSDGVVQMVGRVGPSVISDIDDTIKWSNVASRRELIANTFFRPFREIDGMASLYRDWAAQGTAFHYVSSSPWQLYRPLSDFLEQSEFPAGSFHLRALRLRDPSVLQLVVGRHRSKRRSIKRILKSFSSRQFVLVGDTGEKDPEIYGSVARKYPNQIAQICVRRIPEEPLDYSRLKHAFREIPKDRWRVFESPAELVDLFPQPNFGWQRTRMSGSPSM